MDFRYDRQTRLKGFGSEGQAKLVAGKVLVVGLGGLGLPVVQYLNAMGVGTLGLVDQDIVELHNLQRQVLYSEKDLGKSKLEVVHEKLGAQNASTHFNLYDTFLTKENAMDILQGYDVVVDATDNFPTRYLINDACIILGIPFVYGALHGFEGHVSVFNHQEGPTYRCLYPNMPSSEEVPDCNDNGVLGVIPGIIGTLQALETVKVLTGIGEVLSGKLMVYDGLSQNATKISFTPYPANLKIKRLQDSYESLDCELVLEINVESFQAIRDSATQLTLIDVRTPEEFEQNHLSEARNLQLNQLGEVKPDAVFPQEVYVICQSGKRSAQAVKQLQKLYPNSQFYSILGGMNKMMAISPNL
ncbi:HesA/MoeB/ThiF family protein [Flagellimonas myxillae]|uniref:HesA/MoeB/ThiF family protein n=1 Tax=Flagellimonas myxillae TaxID=2942214 RepID=UPI00201EE345|nr:HesA/MoeB/ThiF family protein [Muricauda myxillae]MCL6265937.1 HesA/MoeB/ThiF family protein [Muricauda myxillae]